MWKSELLLGRQPSCLAADGNPSQVRLRQIGGLQASPGKVGPSQARQVEVGPLQVG